MKPLHSYTIEQLKEARKLLSKAANTISIRRFVHSEIYQRTEKLIHELDEIIAEARKLVKKK